MKTTRHDSYDCPYCGEPVDSNTSMNADAVPDEGMIGVCLYCELPGTFVKGMKIRRLWPREMFGVLSDPNIQRMLDGIEEMKGKPDAPAALRRRAVDGTKRRRDG